MSAQIAKPTRAPRGGDDQGRSPGVEPKPLPEDQVALAIDADLAIGSAESQGVDRDARRVLDEPGGDAIPHWRLRWRRCEMVGPSGVSLYGPKSGAEAVPGVEQLGQNGQLHAAFMGGAADRRLGAD